MKVLGTVLLALIMESSVLGFEVLTHQRPFNASASFALGQDVKAAEKAEKALKAVDPKGGYLGIRISNNIVQSVFVASPAEKAGLVTGDKIMDVDSVSTFGLTTQGLVDKLVGEEGAPVELIVEHGDVLRKVSIVRDKPTAVESVEIADAAEALRKSLTSQ